MNAVFRSTLLYLAAGFLWGNCVANGADTIEDRIVKDRVGTYEELTKRLREKGPNASFPEFKPVVDKLIEDLKADWFLAAIEREPVLKMELEEVQTTLFHVNVTFSYDDQILYPYATPFEGIYPYRPTIDAIEKTVALFDKVDRLINPDQVVPLYHFDRYAYHRHNMISDPRVVIIPTMSSLGFNELIQVRSVPIGFIGVSTRGLRVDRHYQTPLDFWYHDLNHVRRMVEYMFQALRQMRSYTFEEEMAYYRSMDNFISNTLMPHLQKIPMKNDREKFAKRAMLRVLVFEILHESALPATRQWIIDDLLRRPGTTQPFEVMLEEAPKGKGGFQNESRRTTTGNLVSGSREYRAEAGKSVNVHFIHDRALSLLANVYNKLTHGFFDAPEDPKNYVVPVDYRTPEAVLEATKKLFAILEYKTPPDDETLLGWITSKTGSPEKFTYDSIRKSQDQGIANGKGGPKSVSEILDKAAAIQHANQIKGSKRIVTFMGNSANGYEHPAVVDEILIEKLKSMDPKTDIVNCGGTKEGISRVYVLAHAMGFETMGVTSTQALSYSGRFASHVDHHILVGDPNWGGKDASGQLTPVTDVFVTISDELFAVGGGQNTAITIQAAEERGKPLSYRAAEMSYESARREALYRKLPAPSTYEGLAFHEWKRIAEQRVRRTKIQLGCAESILEEAK
jgi:hypothetical protein